MDLILASSDGRELRAVFDDIDIQIGGSDGSTFELSVPAGDWTGDLKHGCLLYDPDTEYGGIIHDIEMSTDKKVVFVRGFTWRGYLEKRIISPPSGQDYRTVSGELNSVINAVLNGSLGPLFRVSSTSTGKTVSNYQFNRYVTFVDGISVMLLSVGYRLEIAYRQTQTSGYVELAAVPIENYGDAADISQDYSLQFSINDNQMGVNHLICLGQGELKDRTVLHLYADKNGNISETQTLFGINEIVEVYDNTSAGADELERAGTDKLKQLVSFKEFNVFFGESDNQDINIGDTITGRDYITGIVVTKPIVSKIITRSKGVITTEYTVEGEQ